jgi:hypothetical protein
MTYSSGNTILAADYNSFVSTINTVIGNSASYKSGSGYGQSSIATVSASATIGASEWGTLMTAVTNAATHQGTSITIGSNPSTSDTIEALDGSTAGSGTLNLSTAVSSVSSNANNVDASEQTTVAGAAVSSRSGTWGNPATETINAEVYSQFSSQVALDAFFNTGGEIHLTFQHASGSSAQDVDWRAIFSTKVGTLKLQKTSIARTGSSGTFASFGYTSLTSSYQNIFTGTNIGGGAYAANDMTVTAKLDETNHRIYFVITLVDQSTAVAPSNADTVQAGTAVSIGYRKSTVYSPATPTNVQVDAF